MIGLVVEPICQHAEGWLPRGECGPWSFWLMARYITASALIGLAYYAIPAKLVFAWIRAQEDIYLPFAGLVLGFAAFIWLCGTGHWIENIGSFFFPNYQIFTVWHELTAVVSLFVAWKLPSGRIVKVIDDEHRKHVASLKQESEERLKELQKMEDSKK